MAMEAFDLAERFQTLVFVMSDLDLGMNTWMAQPFSYPEGPLDRGKVLDEETLARLGAVGPLQGRRRRRRSRTARIPGTGMPAYFTRGSGHNERGHVQRASGRLRAQRRPAGPQVRDRAAIRAAADRRRSGRRANRDHRLRLEPLGDRREPGADRAARAASATGYLRLRAYPFTDELSAFIDRYDRVYVVEQNRDAQMLALMRLDLAPAQSASCAACCTTTGCRSTPGRSPTRCWSRKAGRRNARPRRAASA